MHEVRPSGDNVGHNIHYCLVWEAGAKSVRVHTENTVRSDSGVRSQSRLEPETEETPESASVTQWSQSASAGSRTTS